MTTHQPSVSGIDHLSLSVTDPARSAQFYREVLGFDLRQLPLNYPNKLNAGAHYFAAGDVEITLLRLSALWPKTNLASLEWAWITCRFVSTQRQNSMHWSVD
jgi:catechol 2,3-dioxygenase-like lactoylglutathione lyase family enzyme